MSALLQPVQRRFHHPVGIHLHQRRGLPPGLPARFSQTLPHSGRLSIGGAHHGQMVVFSVIFQIIGGNHFVLHDDPVHQRISDIGKFHLPVEQHQISPFCRLVQHPFIELDVKGVVHIFAVKQDLLRPSLLQGNGHRIRRVVQLLRDLQDPFLLLFRHVAAVV